VLLVGREYCISSVSSILRSPHTAALAVNFFCLGGPARRDGGKIVSGIILPLPPPLPRGVSKTKIQDRPVLKIVYFL